MKEIRYVRDFLNKNNNDETQVDFDKLDLLEL